ncbi:hypothetical protein EV279_0167 [Microbacterium sp. BK668]|nr:hypothetical protein EV279_0167 [Microbacterium sp. BK668]
MPETVPERVGRRAMFWTWMGLIAFGLVTFFVIPLLGR